MLQSKQASSVVKEYSSRVRAFKPNARLYLSSVIITGAAMGVYRLLFNFYALSLGYDEALLGKLVTVSSLTALLAALPMGYLSDLIGRKASLVISGIMLSTSIFVIVFWQGIFVLYAMNVLSGLAQSLSAVTIAPFLMENSGEQERTYLFSFSRACKWPWPRWAIGSAVTCLPGLLRCAACSHQQHSLCRGFTGHCLVAGIGVIPLFFLRQPALQRAERSVFAPLSYAVKQPVLLTKLILPMLITSIGAGMIMPFMNVFFRQVYHQPDPVIGTLFAWGSLAMGIGLLIAPPLAERMGKIQLVVITQALSIPFLIILGFAPVFWMSALAYYVRLALMNMSGPVYQTFVMEHVEPSARATVASLVSMAWNFGWAFSPSISGWLQVNYGFGPPFLGTIFLYTVSIFLYWAFFWRGKESPAVSQSPAIDLPPHAGFVTSPLICIKWNDRDQPFPVGNESTATIDVRRLDQMEMIIDFPGGSRVDAHFGTFTIHTDQPPAATAPTPFATFLASLGTCAGIYVLGFCQQRGLPSEGIRIVQRMHTDPVDRHGWQDRPGNPGAALLPGEIFTLPGARR